MSECTVSATEPEEHGDFRFFQPTQILEWESAELELRCDQVQRQVDVRVLEMVPFVRPFNQMWTMSNQFGEEWYKDFKEVRIKDSDQIDLVTLGNFVKLYNLECRYSPANFFPWAQDGITKCRVNQGPWQFFYSNLDDASKR
jgi:hypothetical protein